MSLRGIPFSLLFFMLVHSVAEVDKSVLKSDSRAHEKQEAAANTYTHL